MPIGTTYYDQYISRAKQNSASIIDTLSANMDNTVQQFNTIPQEKWDFRYAPDKWSIKELVLHIIDCERIFCTRALAFARGDEQPISGFDQDAYVQNSFADYRSSKSLIEEYEAVRKSSILLFEGFSDTTLQKSGTANNVVFTVEEIGYILAGHNLHHLDILHERYL